MENIKKVARVGVLQANLLSMNFEDNYRILLKSLQLAEKEGANILVCPELCIPGYNCEDHFLEKDTITHSWEVLGKILGGAPNNLLYILGMPILYEKSLYSCLVCCLNKSILLIRPKAILKNSGNVVESRWFTAWKGGVCDYTLPDVINSIKGQRKCKFGVGLLRTADGILLEPQTESEVYNNPTKADILMISSSAHYELSLYEKRLKHLTCLSEQSETVVICSNYVGCNGNRLYYEGGSLIISNGQILSQAPRFSLQEFDIVCANIFIDNPLSYIDKTIDIELSLPQHNFISQKITKPIEVKALKVHEELGYSASGWIWDYLRKVGAIGYFVPLSGGADSASCVVILGILGERLFEEYNKGNTNVIKEIKRISGDEIPTDVKCITSKILYTAYLGTVNSSKETRERANKLAEELGAKHIDGSIDDAIDGIKKTAYQMTNFVPKFESEGGTGAEDLALQNIQARSRLILSYYVAQVLSVMTKRKGFFLVVATGNGDECIRGYFTKYDNSSGDLNPIGGWSKGMINTFLDGWRYKYPILKEVRDAIPSAELKPLTGGKQAQTDEQDMKFTYEELGLLSKLRKIDKCGPVSMFTKLIGLWEGRDIKEIANKVKRFFMYYAINRHKMTCAPVALYTSPGGCDDNRYDQRQFVYDITWKYQFECIDNMVIMYNTGY